MTGEYLELYPAKRGTLDDLSPVLVQASKREAPKEHKEPSQNDEPPMRMRPPVVRQMTGKTPARLGAP